MKIRTFGLQFKEGLIGLWRNRVMSLASIGSVTAVLLVLGLSLVLIVNVNSIAEYVESSVEIKVFLIDELDSSQVETIGAKIKQLEGIKEITFESKEQALEKYKKQLGNNNNLLEGLEGENNPLPSSYIVKVEDPNTIGDTAGKISAFEGVEEVTYGKDVVDRLLKSTYMIRIVGSILIGILALISIFIISNTIKLTVAARRKEINIMKFVGATDGFIRLPFVIEGLVLGLIGAVLSSGMLVALYNYFYSIMGRNFGSFFILVSSSLAPFNQTMYNTSLVLLAVGVFIGIIGSAVSLRKFLNV
ncbi:MAG: Cell-division-associated, ABC-transporter-like signaling protein FtsX [Firmicutes bacterium]|nr:Cell-division-associated, ABC-transporter-like signaling protein FtsX [Bacillota bacterium]MDI6704877.1 permease-like cell division protein FtsX [Bacillota bacterium]